MEVIIKIDNWIKKEYFVGANDTNFNIYNVSQSFPFTGFQLLSSMHHFKVYEVCET